MTIQTVMDDFSTTFAEELKSQRRRNPARAFYKFTQAQQLWLGDRMNIVKPVLSPGDLLLWLSSVPHCSHAAGEHRISRRGLFITANLRHNADAKALKQRLKNVEKGKIGRHNCLQASGMSGSASQRVLQCCVSDPIIYSMAGGELAAAEFAKAFKAFSQSVQH